MLQKPRDFILELPGKESDPRLKPTTIAIQYPGNGAGLSAAVPSVMLASGLVVAQGERRPTRRASSATIASPIVLLRRDGTVVDTVTVPTVPAPPQIVVMLAPGRPSVFMQPFQADPLWAGRAGGDGIVSIDVRELGQARSPVITVQVFDALGRRIRTRDYPFEPAMISSKIVDSVVKAQVALAKAPDPDEAARLLSARLNTPKYLPPVVALILGRDGSIWLQRERIPNAGLLWNVIDAAGDHIANVVMPAGVRLMYADMTQAYGVERDTDGIPTIVRYRVVR